MSPLVGFAYFYIISPGCTISPVSAKILNGNESYPAPMVNYILIYIVIYLSGVETKHRAPGNLDDVEASKLVEDRAPEAIARGEKRQSELADKRKI